MTFHIILCTYNPRPEYLREQLASLTAQTHQDWTCHILDDQSGPESLASTRAAAGTDSRFTLHPGMERLGVFHNFERGLTLVPDQTDLICYCDQDDIWEPDKLETLHKTFADPEIILAHSDLCLVDAQGRETHPSCFGYEHRNVDGITLPALVLRNCVTGCTAAFRSELVPYLLPFPGQGVHPLFHHDLWTALIAIQHGRIAVIKRPLVRYRQHGNNIIGAEPRLRLNLGARLRDAVGAWRLRETIIRHLLAHCDAAQKARPNAPAPCPSNPELEEMRSWLQGRFLSLPQLRLLAGMAWRRDPNLGLAGRITLGKAVAGMSFVPALYRVSRQALRLLWQVCTDAAVRHRVLAGMDQICSPSEILVADASAPQDGRIETVLPVTCRPMRVMGLDNAPGALNVLVPGLVPEHVFGGVATAVKLALALADQGLRIRLVSSDGPLAAADRPRIRDFLARRFNVDHQILDQVEILDATAYAPVHGLSKNDTFLATAWWTAVKIRETSARHPFVQKRFVYLIQDYEPGFHPWSDDYALAQATYGYNCIPVTNTTLLADFLEQNTALRPDPELILGPEIDWSSFHPASAEDIAGRAKRRVFVYGRPSVPRNLFRTVLAGLGGFILDQGLDADKLEVVSAGQPHAPLILENGIVMRSLGKLDMAGYAAELRASDLGLSLMLSPHPSYPPLEMAASGMVVVTNRFANKNLDYTPNLLCCEPEPEDLARTLGHAWSRLDDVSTRINASGLRPDLGRSLGQVAEALARRLKPPSSTHLA
ncbi:rhamnosyltransferase WsaF family glycosyltransferase [Desulfonatronum lacustre]|uniref:rhamnosyltransferase WsaF family glycosyltransferase n=1 Tax=Desulfonatronum lacustre TaxID=66849 RepID=UPI00048EC473|nr:glycosyltransferase [Desulfonatronum lacustre]